MQAIDKLEDKSTYSLTIEDVSQLLNLEKSTIYKYLRAGDLPGGRKIGGSWVIVKKELKNFLEGKN